jgi:superfamily II DNA/RNA helicase
VYDGKDVIAKARTGTGKTLSFALPLIETLNKNPITTPGRTPRVLVMAPTRELARQVCADFEIVAPHLKSLCVYGGAPYETQRECVCVCVCACSPFTRCDCSIWLPVLFCSVCMWQWSVFQPALGAHRAFLEDALRRGVDVLVGTPGRINDLLERGSISFKTIQ